MKTNELDDPDGERLAVYRYHHEIQAQRLARIARKARHVLFQCHSSARRVAEYARDRHADLYVLQNMYRNATPAVLRQMIAWAQVRLAELEAKK